MMDSGRLAWHQNRARHPQAEAARQRGAWVGVDLVAVADNVRALRQWVGPFTELMAVVKADAYGHGAEAVASAAVAAGAGALGVATTEEGARLRRAGLEVPILVLGILPDAALGPAFEAGLQVTIASLRQLQVAERVAKHLGRRGQVHLKVNTGMTRVGCEAHELPGLVAYALRSQVIQLVGVASHLASAEVPDCPQTEAQIRRFSELVEALPLPATVSRHIANSAGALYWPSARFDMVRVGLAMYGACPRPEEASPVPLVPAMSVRAQIVQVKEAQAGVQVGYGGTWSKESPTRLVVVPVGYADGLPRSLSNRGHVLVRGVPRPIAGRVSMDQIVVDCGDLPVEPGEEVVVLGPPGRGVGVEAWAGLAQTISYEVMTGLGARLPRLPYR